MLGLPPSLEHVVIYGQPFALIYAVFDYFGPDDNVLFSGRNGKVIENRGKFEKNFGKN
jgi:hypothetical protein